jgi:glycogen debranching enzyme
MHPLSDSALDVIDTLTAEHGYPLASAPPSDDEPVGRYAALFGRDALITALQFLPVRPGMAGSTLQALGARQGRRSCAARAEEVGKILHEYWPTAPAWHREHGWPIGSTGSLHYFGSVDATPLYLILAARVGLQDATVDLAMEWLETALSDTGLLTYTGHREGGLYDQGWRDGIWGKKDVGVRWPDGSHVEGPVAVASAQAFAYEALRSHGRHTEARRLAEAVDAAFFRHGEPWPALAVDGHGVAVPTQASEMGVLLWSGILGPERIRPTVAALSSLSTRWGLRTISRSHPCFAPDAYHLGAVWPFECWFAWGGLRRAGADDLARNVQAGVLDAIAVLREMPECYAVPLEEQEPTLVSRATRTQAWTAGATWALENEWDGLAGPIPASR